MKSPAPAAGPRRCGCELARLVGPTGPRAVTWEQPALVMLTGLGVLDQALSHVQVEVPEQRRTGLAALGPSQRRPRLVPVQLPIHLDFAGRQVKVVHPQGEKLVDAHPGREREQHQPPPVVGVLALHSFGVAVDVVGGRAVLQKDAEVLALALLLRLLLRARGDLGTSRGERKPLVRDEVAAVDPERDQRAKCPGDSRDHLGRGPGPVRCVEHRSPVVQLSLTAGHFTHLVPDPAVPY